MINFQSRKRQLRQSSTGRNAFSQKNLRSFSSTSPPSLMPYLKINPCSFFKKGMTPCHGVIPWPYGIYIYKLLRGATHFVKWKRSFSFQRTPNGSFRIAKSKHGPFSNTKSLPFSDCDHDWDAFVPFPIANSCYQPLSKPTWRCKRDFAVFCLIPHRKIGQMSTPLLNFSPNILRKI